jgi:hypothetical protein
MLRVSRPSRNTNGSPATNLRKVQVLRLIEDTSKGEDGRPLSSEQFLKQAAPIITIMAQDFSDYLHDDAFVVRDRVRLTQQSTMYTSLFRYAVLFVNNKDQAAGISNQAWIEPLPIPPAPEGLAAEVSENSIRLKWSAPTRNMDGSEPAHSAGYYVYRSQDPEKMPAEPMNSEPVKKPEYEDRNFQFGRTYYFAIRIIGSLKNPYAESLLSEVLAVTPMDKFAPAPPENLNAVREGNSIVLLWAPSSSPDVAGYRIYRREEGASTSRLLEKELIQKLSYRDINADLDKRYEYTIQAVDAYGNASPPLRISVESR